ncbi:Uncharacterized membrane protein [Octadecabacter temperatus]|uniref:Uncharacterized protein n=1 Tax=Octadecabacter temperatus TaxID=1458307 RepID=A0A0K0Y609_9RHOB|nr:DUF2189 domain-containing protein [Octadecabacter temperatus]AKS46267.1 hypothetical protein OSB_17190 [Octadecabacter temperatus]SIO10878.1 Uncharacterized membrane protein [Octadecabacter temperatus]
MSQAEHPTASPVPEIGTVTLVEVWVCLKAGLADFRAAPQFGLFFSAVYVVGGFVMLWLGAGHVSWTLATSLGFPLAAPFAAVGLYEVSRRLENGDALDWREVLGVVWKERTKQVPWIGAIILFYFLFWTFLAHMIFALFMGLSAMTNISTSWDVFFTSNGLTMIAVELGVGGVLAFLLFSLTVVSLPLVLDKEIDFVTAMLLSLSCVKANFRIMLVWAAIIAVMTFVALLPWFLGLVVVLPILGHATWHMYRRALYSPV